MREGKGLRCVNVCVLIYIEKEGRDGVVGGVGCMMGDGVYVSVC